MLFTGAPMLMMGGMGGRMMMTQMPIIFLGGRPYLLKECDGRDVYCNALEGFAPLDEGANGNRQWHYMSPPPDPSEVDPWLHNVGGGIY